MDNLHSITEERRRDMKWIRSFIGIIVIAGKIIRLLIIFLFLLLDYAIRKKRGERAFRKELSAMGITTDAKRAIISKYRENGIGEMLRGASPVQTHWGHSSTHGII